VRYISKESTHPVPSAKNGFWVKDDKVYDVTSSTHVQFMIDNPSLFGLTTERIRSVYEKHGEQVGTEQKAREELIRHAAAMGWIRVRKYEKPSYSLSGNS